MSESISQQETENRAASARAAAPAGRDLRGNLRPLALDLAVPIGSYYLLRDAFGLSQVLSLGLGSIVPAARTVWSALRDRRLNALAGLMLAVNVIGIALTFVTGDPRVMLAKDSGVSSVIGICILASAVGGRPLMSAGLKPWLTKGDPARITAWERLSAGSDRFRSLERRFSAIWGAALLAECVARLVGAFTLPVATMVWLGTVLTIAAILVGIGFSGIATAPMERLIAAEAAPDAA